jgi:urease accessory protein
VRAQAAVAAEAGGDGRTRITLLRSQAPLVLRPTAEAVYLAAGAGGPVGGDALELSVSVGPGAELIVRTVGATVVLPGRGEPPAESSMALRLRVAAGGRLTVLPEPTVVASGARHRLVAEAEVEAGGALVLREEVVLGRHGEAGGAYRGLLRVDVAGVPLLRHELALDGGEDTTLARASVTGARASGSMLVVEPGWARPEDRPAGWTEADVAAMPLAGPGLLVTALAADAPTLRVRLDQGGWNDGLDE